MKIKSNWGIILIIFVIVSCFILLRAQIAFAGEKEVWFTPQVNWGGLLKSQKISGETLPNFINGQLGQLLFWQQLCLLLLGFSG